MGGRALIFGRPFDHEHPIGRALTLGQRWEVVGGGDRGGIVVRAQPSDIRNWAKSSE